MKILVKKDNGLVNIGEGKIYSKSQLKLNEIEGDNGTTVTSTDTTTPNQGLADGVKQLNKAPQANAFEKTVGGMDGNVKDDGTTLTMSKQVAQSAKGKQDANNFIKMSQNTTNGDQNKIRIVNTPSVQLSHKAPRKVLDELRKNSIPFTKKELHKFLREI
jgi:hypothetical protein